jgi:hypothetical protein
LSGAVGRFGSVFGSTFGVASINRTVSNVLEGAQLRLYRKRNDEAMGFFHRCVPLVIAHKSQSSA